MKTSTQWLAILADSDTAKTACEVTERDIAAIQADALRHAADFAEKSMSWLIAKELNAEADKLEGK